MLEFTGINVWAVVVVWAIYVVIGAFWYSPAGFGKQWTKHSGVDIMKIPQDEATRALLFVVLSTLVQAITLAVIINSLQITSALDGLAVGFMLWLGLTAATTVGVTLYSRKSWSFLWLNSSYFLLVMLIGSLILAIW